ncbi:hypothetical protein NPIL_364321 [Nephila pilipes]|uniref:Uncharacterized protein n=1 Tax=Nephila pilipes TaxID=299642 RepID=A0A8X6PRE7_NEPPI|nr:hypothetical protein NPIL_364321 [Nephila pilipes]
MPSFLRFPPMNICCADCCACCHSIARSSHCMSFRFSLCSLHPFVNRVAESDFVMRDDNISNPDSAMSDKVHCKNNFSVAESAFAIDDNYSNPDSAMSDKVHCTNNFSVDESDFAIDDNYSNPDSVMSDKVHSLVI